MQASCIEAMQEDLIIKRCEVNIFAIREEANLSGQLYASLETLSTVSYG